MDFIYNIFDMYINVISSFYSIFISKQGTIEFLSTFTAFIPLMYFTAAPIMLTADGSEEINKLERFILSIVYALMLAGLIALFRGFGKTELSGAYIFWVWIIGIIASISYIRDVKIISDGIKRSEKD